MAMPPIKRKISGHINLNNPKGLKTMVMTTKKGTKGVFIPFEANGVESYLSKEAKEGDAPMYKLNIEILEYEHDDDWDQSGAITNKPKTGKKWQEMSKEEQDEHNAKSAFIGSIKIWGSGRTAPQSDPEEYEEESDELPF